MHDSYTVAFEIRSPIGKKTKLCPHGYHDVWVTIWHVDPETDGSDNSCDWWGRKRKLSAKEKAIVDAVWNLETILDNRPFYPDHEAHLRFQPVKEAAYALHQVTGFRIHPRWHIWHWEIQVRMFIDLKRWLWSRCSKCGQRFKWGYAPVSGQWDDEGPRWFRGETQVFHHECCTLFGEGALPKQ